MAAAKMRHHNSPEELAKRDGEAAQGTPRNRQEFRHYNHPEEVAKRARAGKVGGGSVVAPAKRVVQTTSEEIWPPAGTVDNTAHVSVKQLEAEAGAREAMAALERDQLGVEGPAGLTMGQRVRKLEVLLYTFVDDIREAREFRRLLNNQQAVTDGMASVGERLNAIELQIEAAIAEGEAEADEGDDVDDEGDDDGPTDAGEAPDSPATDTEPPATVPDLPKPGGST